MYKLSMNEQSEEETRIKINKIQIRVRGMKRRTHAWQMHFFFRSHYTFSGRRPSEWNPRNGTLAFRLIVKTLFQRNPTAASTARITDNRVIYLIYFILFYLTFIILSSGFSCSLISSI